MEGMDRVYDLYSILMNLKSRCSVLSESGVVLEVAGITGILS